ncbi:hypothetical protein J437_LFUL008906 [Ladona fulva]|uniref:CUB domain-containing protein n=1 Tax=Ladona fulva TaxID=123851 RepID=A0A8K0K5A9_LADFU|nr:hypothetical protein J437_LFUL008906 [Ladona fulva]
MDLAGNVGGRPGGISANRLWPWALRLLSLIGGGREPQELNLPSVYYGCDYYQKIPIGSTYYIFSPGFDSGTTFPKGIACRWEAEAPVMSHLELNCMHFKVGKRDFKSNNCTNDRLLVSATGDPAMTDAEVHCGEGNFKITSARNKMLLVFLADDENDPMDRFLCYIKAVRDEVLACDCGQWNQVCCQFVRKQGILYPRTAVVK